MALAFSSSSVIHGSLSSSSYEQQSKVSQMGIIQPMDQSQIALKAVNFTHTQRRLGMKQLVPLAATVIAPEVEEKAEAEDYEKLAKELTNASPLKIMDKALEKFGSEIAIAFSGAEDVALLEYARLTGRPFRVFSLDTGRLNPETYQLFDAVEKHYGIRIEYTFPDAVEVQALVRNNDIWNFLRAMNVPVNSLHSQGYVSIGCEPCTRAVLPGQHEREGRWWWEDSKAKECGLHKGNIKDESLNGNGNGAVYANGSAAVADIFDTNNIVSLSRPGIENLLKLENRREPWLVVLYAPWCRFCQAMEGSYVELAEKLESSGVKVAKCRGDGEQKAFAQKELQLGSFPTILFFPRHSSQPIKYPSEKRDIDSLLAFVNALR